MQGGMANIYALFRDRVGADRVANWMTNANGTAYVYPGKTRTKVLGRISADLIDALSVELEQNGGWLYRVRVGRKASWSPKSKPKPATVAARRQQWYTM